MESDDDERTEKHLKVLMGVHVMREEHLTEEEIEKLRVDIREDIRAKRTAEGKVNDAVIGENKRLVEEEG